MNGQVSYSLQESPNTLKLLNKNLLLNRIFEIDSNKGWITLVHPLLSLPKSLTTYELIVLARDAGDTPLETNTLVIISIQGTNNLNQPKINILLFNDNNRPELNESAKIDEIVARITITDEDESEQTNKMIYKLNLEEISSNQTLLVPKFKIREIDHNTYLLIVSDKLDREQQDQFDLKFTAYQTNKSSLNGSEILRLRLIGNYFFCFF